MAEEVYKTKTDELSATIKKCTTHAALKKLWKERKTDEGDDIWPKGKLMEFLIVRAFELENKKDKPIYVTYPEGIRDESKRWDLEQIDGAVHVMDLHALIECKDYSNGHKIEIEPLVKLRFRLQVRHSSAFGIFFSSTEMTDPAEYWIQYMAPQLIIFWGKEDLEYCLDNACFVECLETKYRKAVVERDYNYSFSIHKSDTDIKEVPLWEDQ